MTYTYMIPVYALLVKGGRYAISAEGNTNGLPVVPDEYQRLVAEKLANGSAIEFEKVANVS